jgi:mRNA interferase MazF
MKRGEVYLAYLNPNKGREVGKLRPVLMFQSDFLNEVSHPTVIILPLTTQLIDDAYPLRYRISKRDKLLRDSDVLCDQIRAVSIERIKNDLICKINENEITEIEKQVGLVLGFM